MKRIEFKFADSALLRTFFRDILTGKDGVSFDAGRSMGLVLGIVFVLGAIAQMAAIGYDLVANGKYNEFPFMSFGGGAAALAGGTGVLLKLKENTEPDKP